MNRATVHEELSLSWPDGFRVMGEDELDKLYSAHDPNRWGIWDQQRHIIITVLWQQVHPLLAWLSDMKAMARRNEQLAKKGYQGHGYQLEDFFSRQLCGRGGEGYRFSYRLGDVTQTAETVLFKNGKNVYSLSCIGRQENSAQDRETFEKVLNSVKIL